MIIFADHYLLILVLVVASAVAGHVCPAPAHPGRRPRLPETILDAVAVAPAFIHIASPGGHAGDGMCKSGRQAIEQRSGWPQ